MTPAEPEDELTAADATAAADSTRGAIGATHDAVDPVDTAAAATADAAIATQSAVAGIA